MSRPALLQARRRLPQLRTRPGAVTAHHARAVRHLGKAQPAVGLRVLPVHLLRDLLPGRLQPLAPGGARRARASATAGGPGADACAGGARAHAAASERRARRRAPRERDAGRADAGAPARARVVSVRFALP